MFLFRLFALIMIVFTTLVVGLGLTLWLAIRRFLQNPFQRESQPVPPPHAQSSGEVIEGEFRVINEE